MNEQSVTDARIPFRPPHPWGWPIRVGVYAMLVASASCAFFLDQRLWQAARIGEVPEWAPLVPVLTFTAFVVIYSIDRSLLVWRRAYPIMRAFFQVALAVVFLSFLWPRQATEMRAMRDARPQTPTLRLLSHRDAEVRAAACELVALRREVAVAARLAELAQNDGDPAVRQTCAAAIASLGSATAPPRVP